MEGGPSIFFASKFFYSSVSFPVFSKHYTTLFSEFWNNYCELQQPLNSLSNLHFPKYTLHFRLLILTTSLNILVRYLKHLLSILCYIAC